VCCTEYIRHKQVAVVITGVSVPLGKLYVISETIQQNRINVGLFIIGRPTDVSPMNLYCG